MKIQNVSNLNSLSFGRALTGSEEADFKNTCKQAEKALGVDDGLTLFKVFPQSLPQGEQNTGVGKINSNEALEYLKFMKLYTGCNAVKIYPIGEMKSRIKHYYCPYERSGVTIGEDNINYYKLATPEYGSLLTPEDTARFKLSEQETSVDFENELAGKKALSKTVLAKAYQNLNAKQAPETEAIKKEFEDFKSSLKSDTLDRLAIAPFVSKKDPNLFVNFSENKDSQKRFEGYKEQYAKEIDIFKFGKFLALKNLQEAKENLAEEGLELYGDCPIGFTNDEVFAFPDAFYPKNITPGWGFRAIKYDEVPKEGTEANKLFKEKISWHLKAFDGIRFDVGWQYITPKLIKNKKPMELDVKNGVIDTIEKTAKEIKGQDYDTAKLMYECDAGADDFQMFDWSKGKPAAYKKMKGKTAVLSTTYEHADGYGWGNPDFFKAAGLNAYTIGVCNHDGIPLRALAEDDIDDRGNELIELKPIRKGNVEALNKSMGLSKKFLSNPDNLVKAKFAELFKAERRFLFFNDVMGNKERVDRENADPSNYRIKISKDYEREYHTALQQNHGFNLAESLKLAMKANGINKTNPKLYSKIAKYSAILREEGAKTKAEAEAQAGAKTKH